MRGATGLTIQLYQILRLPRKMNPMIDPRLAYETSFRMRGATPPSPNTAPATQNESHD